ncbi:MAG: T9SS type A sorting domain-containing protein [Bacteroidota bacterium]
MKRYLQLLMIVVFAGSGTMYANGKGEATEKNQKASQLASNVYFFENQGEYLDEVSYYARASYGNVFVKNNGQLVYSLAKRENDKVQNIAVFETFPESNPSAIYGTSGTKGKFHRFKGKNHQLSAKTNYETVQIDELFDGIDLELKMHTDNIEKIFAVKPGASASDIQIELDGCNGLDTDNGMLILNTSEGKISFTKPVAYQIINGVKKEIEVRYSISADNSYGFTVGDYNSEYTLYIDPLLASTYAGGTSNDYGKSMAFDQNGKLFVTGYTWSGNYPTTAGAFDETYNGGDYDVFVSRFDSTLTTLEASTFIGGGQYDMGMSMTIDTATNDVIIAGEVQSTDFPVTPGCYASTHSGGDSDIFVSRLSNDLSSLIASTYLGGNNPDNVTDIIYNHNSNTIYVTGATESSDYPTTTGAFDETFDGPNSAVILSQFNDDLTSLLSSTLIEGNSSDKAQAIKLDQNDDIILTGYTGSFTWPTTAGAYDQIHNSSNDVFITRISEDLSTIMHSTLIGGASYERGNDLLIDANNDIFVLGYTASDNYPTTAGAFNTSFNGAVDAFITKISSTLDQVYHSTFVGGDQWEYAFNIVMDQDDHIFIAGNTYSVDYPTTYGAYDTVHSDPTNSTDVFITKMDTSLSDVLASTFIGGSTFDYQEDLIMDMYNQVFITGYTASGDYPVTPGAYNEMFNGTPVSTREIFISKFDKNLSTEPPVIITHPTDATACENSTAVFTVEATGGGTLSYQWYQGNSGIYNPIPGATNDTLHLMTDISMDGDSVYCEVSNEGGAVISNMALLTVDELIVADAGSDQAMCEIDNTNMAAVPPASGSGTWSLISGSGTIAAVNDPATAVTGLGTGDNYFEWEVVNGTCISSDTVIVTQDTIIPANAGADISICDVDTVLMNASAASPGTGMWTANDDGTVAEPANPNSLISNLPYGTNSFTWEVNNGTCTDTDDVLVTRDSLVIAEAGSDQIFCEYDTTSLDADIPVSGTGVWSVVTGNASFDNPTDPASQVANLDYGNNQLEWTVTNGSCVSTDQVNIQRDSLIPADAGTDLDLCDTYHAVITAENPDPGTGIWSVVSGAGSFAQDNQNTTTVSGLQVGDNVLQWEVTNGTCIDADTLFIHVDTTIQAQAGPDQQICGDSAFLTALNPAPGSGIWSVHNGSGSISQADTTETYITGLQTGSNTIHWTVTNGACQTYDEVEIISDTAVYAEVMADTSICDNNSLTITATDVSPANGWWSIISGGGNIADNTSAVTTIDNLPEGETVLQWHVENGECSDQATVTITRDILVTAVLPDDYAICAEDINLEANDPAPGTGLWQSQGSSAVISEPASHITDISGLDTGENTFTWTITNGTCVSSDTIIITRDSLMIADAGDDISLCQQDSITLDSDDNGNWTLISGSADVNNTSDLAGPIAIITDIGLGANEFAFTMTNGVCVDADTLTITRDSLVTANAGSDQSICDDLNTMLSGTDASFASGLWTVAEGEAVIDNPEQATTGVSELSTGENVFVWTSINGSCMDSDSLTVTRLESVSIIRQPQTRTVIQADTIMFIVEAEGDITGFQWLKDGEELTDTLQYTGTNSDTLKIHRLSYHDEGTYSCLISGECGDVYSNNAELFVNGGVSIYPNPTSGDLYIEISRIEESYQFKLIDATGRVILEDESTHNRQHLDMNNFSAGMYILSIEFDNETINYKVVKD